ncbi:MAG TPA: CpsB/CapC family capsule biosynthesis tyrosine phosphatase [Solirubrobacteraceae bacterium]|nr:CpsB/CapC family capsule biosynthesis tyrosine phosphatase [Solirubrobacteraceae bacterium]
MIDLHTHLLPGLDDGPSTLEGSVALAQAMVAAGTSVAVATPHVSSRYPTFRADIAGAATRLREALVAAGSSWTSERARRSSSCAPATSPTISCTSCA